MSFACVTNYLSENFAPLLLSLANGSCRLMEITDEIDTQGFPSPGYMPRTDDFLPCSWVGKKIDEKIVADQTRALAGYEITVAQKIDGATVICNQSDRLELKLLPSDTQARTLEIVAIINQSNIAWLIYAIDLNADR